MPGWRISSSVGLYTLAGAYIVALDACGDEGTQKLTTGGGSGKGPDEGAHAQMQTHMGKAAEDALPGDMVLLELKRFDIAIPVAAARFRPLGEN